MSNCLPAVVIAIAPPLLALFPSNNELVTDKVPVPPPKITPPFALEVLLLNIQFVKLKSEF